MDGKDASSTPRKALWRSASWTVRSSPTTASNSVPSRPPKPGRAALPPLQPLAITRPPLLTEWPRPACDDAGHCPSTPSSNLSSGSNYFADRECSRVAEHVYLGSDAAARDREVLRRHGITHVLNCVGSACPEYFRGELIYKTLWLHDSPAEDITSVLYDAFDYLEEARLARPPGRVLVHCLRGASRSAALVIAYLMWHRALPFEDALRAVRAARAVTDPNLGFASQLLQCQSRVHALPPSPGSPRRAYRMAPHSPYDPLHLVPKTVDCPSPARLDSRGAFVVHVPSVIYIWLGQQCERAMAASAATAACQIVRYERAQGPVITVHEGSEPSEFWEALQDPASPSTIESMGLGVAGRRRVDLYDLDFEIFRRALKGGIVPPLAMTGSSASPTHLPARDSGWSWLRHKFQSGGAKEFVMEPNEEEEVKDAVQSPGSLSVESTTTLLFSSADSASPPSTFSPISSSSSDWYNLSPPGSKFISGLPPLHPTKETKKNSTCCIQPLAERRGSNAPSLVLPLPASDKSRLSSREIVRDWCLSPPFVSEMELDGGAIYIEQPASDAETDENVDEEDNLQLIHPVLFRWPSMDKVEVIQAEVLDSRSVFLLLAPDSNLRMRKHRANILYLWLGKHSNIISCGDGSDMREEDEKVRRSCLEKIRLDLLDPLGLPLDTPVQIIREGEEPEQFLNYLFSFHLPENSSSQLEE